MHVSGEVGPRTAAGPGSGPLPKNAGGLPSPRSVWIAVAAVALLLAVGAAHSCIQSSLARRIKSAAAAQDWSVSWRSFRLDPTGVAAISGLTLATSRGDTALRADSLIIVPDRWSLLRLSPRIRSLTLAHAQVAMQSRATVDPDTLLPEGPVNVRRERFNRLRASAEQLTRMMLAPARDLPQLALSDVTIESARGEDALVRGARLARLDLSPARDGIRLSAEGEVELEQRVPFQMALEYGDDDRLTGEARLGIPSGDERLEPLRIDVDGRVNQRRGEGTVGLGEPCRVTIGNLPLLVSGEIARKGPRLRLTLAADSVTQSRVSESMPRALLGSLNDISVRGSFDYRLGLDLDITHPDDVDFEAHVLPHGLTLDPRNTRLNLLGLDQPFTAMIHLPRGRLAVRELSPANPHFRPLGSIDSNLVHAVVTNEDGGFFRHRGFNVEAVKMAIAANVKAGAYQRGAGTITMQIARNLYLGHERTLSRKAQEVVLAWVLEHLTGVSKQRLLEIYFNIIEWGPEIHGADEATRYYFDRDAGQLSVPEALFLSTVIPAPSKWRYRFDPSGELRGFARAQMHFIGRAMIAKGWLAPEQLPPADSLRVELRGPARAVFFPPPDTASAVPPGTTSSARGQTIAS